MNAVLLVDDERDFADLLAERLSARGFQVQTAYDGEEALRLAAVHELDVAVLDVNLPGIDGLAVDAAKARGEAVTAMDIRLPSGPLPRASVAKPAAGTE